MSTDIQPVTGVQAEIQAEIQAGVQAGPDPVRLQKHVRTEDEVAVAGAPTPPAGPPKPELPQLEYFDDPEEYPANTTIVVDQVSKNFTMQYQRTFKQVTVAAVKGRKISETFDALQGVSFQVEQGEAVGLMGLNGSGKSTLLKLIQGVMRPDEGMILTRGRVAGLIATSAGFHPQLSGRENVYLNAACLGMDGEWVDEHFEEIADFAEIGDFMEVPVGTYSSGMYARLGFAVAIHVDTDIFLADEVLAVGDKNFKRKCMTKMVEVRDSGKTLFYVSHSTESVRFMCDRAIVLNKGVVGFDGPVNDGIDYFTYGDEPPAYGEFGDLMTEEQMGSDI